MNRFISKDAFHCSKVKSYFLTLQKNLYFKLNVELPIQYYAARWLSTLIIIIIHVFEHINDFWRIM